MDLPKPAEFLVLAARVVSAYVRNNNIQATELPELIETIHAALRGLGEAPAQDAASRPSEKPAVSVKRSITPDYLVCLEDGKKFKSLKRHLKSRYQMTPDQYRKRWGLASDYPMVAPAYARERSQLAKEMGLGQQRRSKLSRTFAV